MDAQEAQATYLQLKGQLDAKQLSFDDFAHRVQELKYQDNTGTWWAVNGADGSWLKWNGSTWEPGFTQGGQATQPAIPSGFTPPVQNVPAQPTQPVSPGYSTPQVPVPPGKAHRNWGAISSLGCSLVSLIFFPYIFGIIAVCIGIIAIYRTKKSSGKIPKGAVVGIIIGLASILFNFFYLDLFAPTILPPLQ